MVGPVAKREAVAHLRGVLEMSERRACSIVAADRKMIRYRSCRPPDTELRARLRELANQRRRFGYRRLFILLRDQGEPSGVNRIYRLYREEGLAVRKRRSRRKAIGTRAPILVEAKPNARWSLDFVHDQLACGRRFRILNIVDDVTRECLAAIPDTSISGKRVARELTTHRRVAWQAADDRVRQRYRVYLERYSWAGPRSIRWNGTTSRPASRCRTATSNPSTAACATNFSTKACFSTSIRLAKSSLPGSPTTTRRGRIPRSVTRRRLAYADHLTATGHRAALHEGSARCPVAHTAPKGVSTAEALIAAG